MKRFPREALASRRSRALHSLRERFGSGFNGGRCGNPCGALVRRLRLRPVPVPPPAAVEGRWGPGAVRAAGFPPNPGFPASPNGPRRPLIRGFAGAQRKPLQAPVPTDDRRPLRQRISAQVRLAQMFQLGQILRQRRDGVAGKVKAAQIPQRTNFRRRPRSRAGQTELFSCGFLRF